MDLAGLAVALEEGDYGEAGGLAGGELAVVQEEGEEDGVGG